MTDKPQMTNDVDGRRVQANAELVRTRETLEQTRARLAELEAHSTQLTLQLEAVGAELAETRDVLAQQVSANDVLRSELAAIQSGADPWNSAERVYRERASLVLLPRLLELLEPGDSFVVVDGGAREVDRDMRWRPFPSGSLRFFGFEPDAAEASRLSGLEQPDGFETRFFPSGLWGFTGKAKFEHNNIGGGSTFLRQNRSVTDRWKFENPTQISLAREIFHPVDHETLDVVSLQDWASRTGIEEIDFLKLNVQGGELEVLRGAGDALDSVLGMMIEVAFVESYESRPMFDEVDGFLRRAGFTFFDLLAHHYIGRADSPVAAQHLSIVEPKLGQLVSAWGQLVEGHALYLRDPIARETPATMSTRRIVKLIALAEAWGQIEFAFELLHWLGRRPDVADSQTGRQLEQIAQDCRDEYLRFIRPGVPDSSSRP